MPDYALYGLVVRCAHTLHGLATAAPGATVDIEISMEGVGQPRGEWTSAAPYYTAGQETDGSPSMRVRLDATRGYRFEYADGTQFVIDPSASTISCWWAAASTLEDTATYLLGPVLGFALRRRGVLALHASAVLLDGRATLLIGPSGAGKSTTAAAFAAAGTPVMSDDVVAVRITDGVPCAYPAYRLLRLWDASEQILFGTTGRLPLLTPTWDKRALPLGAAFPFHDRPAPLGALFVLAPRRDNPRAPFVEPLSSLDGFVELVANTYANYLLDDRMRGEEMRLLSALLRGRHLRRVVPHATPERLPAMVQLIRATVANGR
ncbi:MAG: hypothetical protein HYV19_02155 [Gemmatimonadetes bacterium]|nr:hypothetical protein [Gemmatimonadota bacterium]